MSLSITILASLSRPHQSRTAWSSSMRSSRRGVVHVHLVRRNQGVGAEPGGAQPLDLTLALLSHVEIKLGSDRMDPATCKL
ncbi:hypothetical protein ACFX2K_006012 [Malus domestica]